MFRSTAGWSPDCFAKRVLPSRVSITRSWATWRGKPRWTAASISASITRNTYAGPVPETAVAIATHFSSSTSSSAPSAPSSARAWSRWSAVVAGVAYQTVMPLPMRAGVLGIARTTWSWPSVADEGVGRRAREDRQHELAAAQARARSRLPTRASICGLTARMTTSAAATASTFEATVPMPCAAASASRRSARGWLATSWDGVTRLPRSRPTIIASAMTPEPTVAIVRFVEGGHRAGG